MLRRAERFSWGTATLELTEPEGAPGAVRVACDPAPGRGGAGERGSRAMRREETTVGEGVTGGTHFPFVESPGRFNREVADFLGVQAA